MSPPPT